MFFTARPVNGTSCPGALPGLGAAHFAAAALSFKICLF